MGTEGQFIWEYINIMFLWGRQYFVQIEPEVSCFIFLIKYMKCIKCRPIHAGFNLRHVISFQFLNQHIAARNSWVPCIFTGFPHMYLWGILHLNLKVGRGPPLEYCGAWSFLEINIFVGKMGDINKLPQGMVEIQTILR